MDEGIMEHDVLERIFDGSIKPTDLKLSALQSITGNFSEERIIGTGGFGTVYKGVLRNGQVAVKRIKNNHTIDENVFRREVNSLLQVSHKNIVRFLGFCSHTEHKVFENEGSRDYIYAENRERILCFEYINNGSLEKYITDELRGLQWDTRYFIIKGICDGLQYLHVEKQIIHMDLKPANILIDYNMVAKITDFGLSRMAEDAETKSTTRVSTPGYTAPEYIDKGQMSFMYDVYSLGVVIIELVTGARSIPYSKNLLRWQVLRRWRHRLHKSGKETPLRYKQIDKLIEIGLLCQEEDPYKRPSISDIICAINELESTDRKISNANKYTLGQISPYSEDDMLGIEPLELHFPFELNSQISCSIELTNETNAFIAFNIQTTSPLPYCIQPNKGYVAPQSKYSVNIALQPLDKAPQDKYTGVFIVWSTKVNEDFITEDITEDIFKREEGKLVDHVHLTIAYKAEESQVDVSLGSPIISDMRNLHGPQVSNVLSTEAESKSDYLRRIPLKQPPLETQTQLAHGNAQVIPNQNNSEIKAASPRPCSIPLQYLKDITDNFSDKRILGHGGFGVVYMGVQQNGEMIAVKKIMSSLLPGLQKQFESEVRHLTMLQHPNIVRCVGYCYEVLKECLEYDGKYVFAERAEMLLCLEYMPNRSLDKYISDESSGLDWSTRYNIIKGICYGLCHLHEEIDKPIIHLDLKPANILLDDGMAPKITDFGLSRLLDQHQTICTSSRDGTLGYMAPEILHGGTITPKSDIFSLGVIILEVVTGHKDYPDVTRTPSDDYIELVLEKWRNVLQRSPGYVSLETVCAQIRRYIEVGITCVNPDRNKRPPITKVISMLQGSGSIDYDISKKAM